MNAVQESYLKAFVFNQTMVEAEREINKRVEIELKEAGFDFMKIDYMNENDKGRELFLSLTNKYCREINSFLPFNQTLSATSRKLLKMAENDLIEFAKKNLPKNFSVKSSDIDKMMQHWKYKDKLIKLILKTDFNKKS